MAAHRSTGKHSWRSTDTTSRTSATLGPTPSSTSSSASYGPAAWPSRTYRTSPTWTTRSSAARELRILSAPRRKPPRRLRGV